MGGEEKRKRRVAPSAVSLRLCRSFFHRVSRGLGNVAIDQNATRPDTRGRGLAGDRAHAHSGALVYPRAWLQPRHSALPLLRVLLRFTVCPYLPCSSSLTYFVSLRSAIETHSSCLCLSGENTVPFFFSFLLSFYRAISSSRTFVLYFPPPTGLIYKDS